jgi:hypothetical protein
MGSSKQNRSQVFDKWRGIWVAALPEEIARQKLLHEMVHQLNFPKELIAIEKRVEEIAPSFEGASALPLRRADIVCFAKGIHPDFTLYPLLLVECKKGDLDQKAIDQLLGYNHFVKAYFVALANLQQRCLGYYNKTLQKYEFISFFPSFEQLINIIKHGTHSLPTTFSK